MPDEFTKPLISIPNKNTSSPSRNPTSGTHQKLLSTSPATTLLPSTHRRKNSNSPISTKRKACFCSKRLIRYAIVFTLLIVGLVTVYLMGELTVQTKIIDYIKVPVEVNQTINDVQPSDKTIDQGKDPNIPIKKPDVPVKPRNKFAMALKTGQETYLSRVPIQLLTFLSSVTDILLIGETSNLYVGTHRIHDVITHLYDNHTDNLPEKWRELIVELNSKIHDGIESAQFKSTSENNKKKRKKGEALQQKEKVDKVKQVLEELQPDTSSFGWKADAHKNIPGFKLLYDKYPNADWYIMIDDDTYFNINNFNLLTSSYDPNASWYFGNANVFKGCDNVENFDDGPQFAHGGSGIVISRGAMIKMMKIHESCILKYKDCFAGDIRTALCLRDAGIFITSHHPNPFNNFAPKQDSVNGFPNPCEIPVTFHHLLIPQIQRLHNCNRKVLERARQYKLEILKSEESHNNTGNPIEQLIDKQYPKTKNFDKLSAMTYADVFECFRADLDSTNTTTVGDQDTYDNIVDFNTNRPGNDISHKNGERYEDCIDFCREDVRCVSWTYDAGECWLKQGIPFPQDKKGAISGYLPGKYTCDRGF